MNTTTKVDKSIKQYVLTLKAGKKRTESIYAKKRQLLSYFISNKKIKIGLILCNQKRSVTTALKHLNKEYPDTVFALADLSKKELEDHIKSFKDKTLLLVATNAQLKDFDIKNNITHIIHFDFPIKVSDYIKHAQLASSNKKVAELWSFVSPEDGKHVKMTIEDKALNIQLGRLKGHRNANIGIEFSVKEPIKAEVNKKTARTKKPKEKIEEKPKEKIEKKSEEKPKSPQKSRSPKRQQRNKKEETPEIIAESKKDDSSDKNRSRHRKPQRGQERLPKKRIRHRQNDKIVEAGSEEGTPITETAHTEMKLNIEIKQMTKPKVRRNPQGRIIGMGEHTPAFMLKEIIFKNSTLESDD